MSHLRAARPDRRRALIVLAILIASMCCSAPAMAADLTATPSTFASVFSSAKAGDRILLASGDYGDWAGGSKSGTVTIMPQAGASPVMGINFNNAANIRVDGLTLTWMSIDGASHDLAFANSKFTGAATIRAYSLNNSNIVLDHNTHANINVCGTCYEGRVEVIGNGSGPSGVTIKNSTFGPGGDADGIQIGAIGVKVLNNEFTGIKQVSAVHTDSLQLMGTSQTVVDGNYFHDFSTAIMAPDGGNRDTFTNNVFDGDGSYRPAIQLGSTHDSVFAHNTTRNLDVYMDRKNESTDNSANGVLRDNVIVNGTINTPSAKCTNCTVSYNLFSAAGNASGTNTVVGTPAFAGGANPNSWAGFALASGSPGKANAGDGTDRGIDASGTTPPPPPPPPPADTTAPDTSITSGPTGTTNDGTPTFAFTATETGSTFECRVDVGAWGSCTSPWTTAALSDGAHSVAVRATDAAGNTDASAASRSFTVDATAPDTSITSGPTGTTNDSTPTFAFSATEAGSTFQCRVDTGAWAACTSPWTTAALANGAHSVSVRAIDAAGNTDASAASRSFTVDTTVPDTTPPDTSVTSGPTTPTNDRTPTFAFTATEAGSTFQCRVDAGAWASCTSPWRPAALSDGNHSVAVRATDAAGNTDATPATRSFAVDGTAPRTTIASWPVPVSVDPDPTFTFSANETGVRFECRLDGGAWVPCTSPYQLSGVALGAHTLTVRATDAAGNVEAPGASSSWTSITAPAVPGPGPPAPVPPAPAGAPVDTTRTSAPADAGPLQIAADPLVPATVAATPIDLSAPRTVKVKSNTFSLACGEVCAVKVTATVNRRLVTIARGTGSKVVLTPVGRQALKAAGRQGVQTTVRATAGAVRQRSATRLHLA
jgi:hypothetical protein